MNQKNKTIIVCSAIGGLVLITCVWLFTGNNQVHKIEINGMPVEIGNLVNSLQENENAATTALLEGKTTATGYKIIDGVFAVPIEYGKTGTCCCYKHSDGKVYVKDFNGQTPSLPVDIIADKWVLQERYDNPIWAN